ncbi:hypothetical protein [Methanohalobium sp.]|uniref:hypothetical protein n=1 Tax=Methanohalobium sp. TaxID=2837493 RepID=UPI0025FF7D2D|nr:hypothetical protein [Methanohalobium sp.]
MLAISIILVASIGHIYDYYASKSSADRYYGIVAQKAEITPENYTKIAEEEELDKYPQLKRVLNNESDNEIEINKSEYNRLNNFFNTLPSYESDKYIMYNGSFYQLHFDLEVSYPDGL